MNLEYSFKLGPEAAWVGVAAAVGALASAIAIAVGADANLAAGIATFATAVTRAVLGFIIPQPQ